MATQRKIVVLEDNRYTGALISAILEKEGYHVLHALERRYAIGLVLRDRPSLLISDVLVPDMNGSKVVKEIR
ncbi:MAG: response regulator [Verrucomicrobiota bacterium]|nr:response regulator [Verrucomicrobiota bacterium]